MRSGIRVRILIFNTLLEVAEEEKQETRRKDNCLMLLKRGAKVKPG